jgi:hypothetical protein
MAKYCLKGRGNSGNDVLMSTIDLDGFPDFPAVIKKASSCGLQGNTRLKAQIEKMVNYRTEIQPQSAKLLKAPKVYVCGLTSEGDFQATMEYIPYSDSLEFLSMASFEQAQWFASTITNHIEEELGLCKTESFKNLMPLFSEKCIQLRSAIEGNGFLTFDDVAAAHNILDLALQYGEHLVDTGMCVPVGFCHGDLSLSNVLINGEGREAFLVDFLDTFVDSPIQDIVKVRQDTKYKWITSLEKVTGDLGRILVTLDFIDQHLVGTFEAMEFWPAVPLFDAFSLLRLLPYIKEGPSLTILRSRLRDIPATLGLEAGFAHHVLDHAATTLTPAHTTPAHKVGKSPRKLSELRSKSPKVSATPANVTVVVPAAGRSSRFPGTRPKVYLSNPTGLLMVVDALKGLDLLHVNRILIGVLREHVDQYCGGSVDGILACIEKLGAKVRKMSEIIVIEKETLDPVETVERIIVQGQVTGPIFVKDSDNYFECEVLPLNHVVTLKIDRSNEERIFNVSSKSFTFCSKDNTVSNILEKVIHSDLCNVGGYGFVDSGLFLERVRHIRNSRSLVSQVPELTMTNVIWSMMLTRVVFYAVESRNYQDWGTLTAWNMYCKSFMTIFVDLDGTLVGNSSAFFAPLHGSTGAIEPNVAWLRQRHAAGRTQIIITTSRPESSREVTLRQLEALNIPYDNIIFSLLHCQRVLINDFAPTNPFPSAVAVNLERNSGMLGAMMPR